jgi:hypothetical protein
MQIPHTPEALFEQISDSTVRDLFANYDDLKPRHRKLVHILHTELTKGELSDATFADCLVFITTLWRCFNNTAAAHINRLIEDSDEIDSEWILTALDYARLSQFINACLHLYDAAPDPTEDEDDTTYHLRPRR